MLWSSSKPSILCSIEQQKELIIFYFFFSACLNRRVMASTILENQYQFSKFKAMFAKI